MRKNYLLLLITMCPIMLFGQELMFQKFSVPKLSRPIEATNGEIFMPAYCSDAPRAWPEKGFILKSLNYCEKGTKVRLNVDGKVDEYPLEEALKKGYVKIESTPSKMVTHMQANDAFTRELSLNEYKFLSKVLPKYKTETRMTYLAKTQPTSYSYLQEIGKDLKAKRSIFSLVVGGITMKGDHGAWLLSIESKGFNVGVDPENIDGILSATRELPEDIDTNDKNQKAIQDDFWKKIHGPEKNDPRLRMIRIQELAKMKIGGGVDNRKLPASFETTVREDGRIVIKERKANPGKLYTFHESKTMRDIIDELKENDNDFGGCIEMSPTDSSVVSVKFFGKIGKVIPYEIEFTSEYGLAAIFQIDAQQISKNGVYKGSVKLVHQYDVTVEEQERECRITPSLRICLPVENGSPGIDVCGLKLVMSGKDFDVAF